MTQTEQTPPTQRAPGAGPRIELGAHTLPYRAAPFERALEGIARAGFRYVGIWNDHADGPVVPPDAGAAEIDAVRRRIEAHGLSPRMAFSFGDRSLDREGQVRRTIEVAAALGVGFFTNSGPSPYVRAFTQRKRDMLFHREAEEYFAMLRRLAPVAERAGVTISPKPHMGVTGTGADLADLVELIDSPAVRICYDAGNIAFYEGLKPEEDVKVCASHVRSVCIKDHRGPRFHPDFPVPGDGGVDHASVFRTLLEAGFSGPCLIERLDGTGRAADMSPETIDAALAKAKTYLDTAVAQAQSG